MRGWDEPREEPAGWTCWEHRVHLDDGEPCEECDAEALLAHDLEDHPVACECCGALCAVDQRAGWVACHDCRTQHERGYAAWLAQSLGGVEQGGP